MSKLKHLTTRYNFAPHIGGRSRTKFDLSHNRKTTGNTGDLIPIFCEEVVPGDTWQVKAKGLARLMTSLHQTMDNAFIELAYFYVPMRIIWDDFEYFYSGYNDDPWAQNTTYRIPQINLTNNAVLGSVAPESLLNQLCLPAGSYGNGIGDPYDSITLLPLRAVFQIWNDHFRNENYDSIIAFSKGSGDRYVGSEYILNGSNFYPNTERLKVNRFKDRFSTALPAPQKGDDTSLQISNAPVVLDPELSTYNNMLLKSLGGDAYAISANLKSEIKGSDGVLKGNATGQSQYTELVLDPNGNYVASFENVDAITINNLRLAIASQALKEAKARGGTRFNEYLKNIYGVTISDKTIQRSEFLGGTSTPMNMLEVLQTSETSITALGSGSGHSKTLCEAPEFTKSFEEPGYIIGFVFVRTARSYSQGIDSTFFKRENFDLFNPFFDNIGETPILKKELYAFGSYADRNSVWGYQEAWSRYKENIDRNAGFLQAGIDNTLDTWHYGDDYESSPQISASWLKEGPQQVDRTIAVQSSSGSQWIFDVNTEAYAIRKMNKYSIPNTFGFGAH